MKSRARILAVVSHFIRPSEVWMHRQLMAFSQDELRIIAYQHLHNPQFDVPNASVVAVPSSHNRPLRGWTRRIDKLTTPKLGGPRFGAAHRRWLRDQIETFRPDAIHCQYGTYGLSTLYVARPLGVPVFVQFNGHDLSCFIQRKKPRLRLIDSLNDFAGLVAVANYQSDWLIANGADPHRVVTIPYGAPTEQGLPEKRSGDRACRFLAVGRLCEMKAPLNTVRAFAMCRDQHAGSHLTVIGDGELRPETDLLIDELGLRDHVTMLGVQNADVVRREMLRADVFVQHSVTQVDGTKEGWPVAIGEALARGLPVIATRHAGIVQQVHEGTNGYLSDEHDWPSMGRHMVELAGDANARQQMGQRSIELALDCQKQVDLQREFMLAHTRVGQQSTAITKAA